MLMGYDAGWNQLPQEKNEAYALFSAYRDMGLLRSLRDVANATGKKYSAIAAYADRFDWAGRVAAYDEYNNYRDQVERREAVRIMNERHAKAAVALHDKAMARIATVAPEELSANEVVKWLEASQKIERLARGEVTENIGQQVSAVAQINLSALSDDELTNLELIMKRLSAKTVVSDEGLAALPEGSEA